MAKSRARTRRPAAGRKRTTARRRPSRRRQPREVRLKPVYSRVKETLGQLKRVEQTREVKSAISRLNRCLKDINGICGPDMIIFLPQA